MVVYYAKFRLNIFISNQSNDMHMIFTYNDTLMGLELKQHAYWILAKFEASVLHSSCEILDENLEIDNLFAYLGLWIESSKKKNERN